MICEYHLFDAPTDRDVFQVTLACPIPVELRRKIEPKAPPSAHKPEILTDAKLANTGWLYRGTVTVNDKRLAMLTNDCTGEMEMVGKGDDFRGLTLTETADMHLIFTDAAGKPVKLWVKAPAPAREQ